VLGLKVVLLSVKRDLVSVKRDLISLGAGRAWSQRSALQCSGLVWCLIMV
jgi:hypothetical protein